MSLSTIGKFITLTIVCYVMPSLAALSDGFARDQNTEMLIDDFSDPGLISKLGTQWRGVSDEVMGGVSKASISHQVSSGNTCLRLSGNVRLENDGGFIQAALDLTAARGSLDASDYIGIRLVVRGNGEGYSVHLRTNENTRPWQSYRATFIARSNWETFYIPFSDFTPYRIDVPLDVTQLRRIGLVAIGRAFHADLSICEVAFYR